MIRVKTHWEFSSDDPKSGHKHKRPWRWPYMDELIVAVLVFIALVILLGR